MVSKTQKKSTLKVCKYIYVQGKKKGKKCGRNCRGDLCKFHNKSTVERKHQYYKEVKTEKDNQKTKIVIKKIKNGIITDISTYRLKLGKLESNSKYLVKKLLGIYAITEQMSDSEILRKYDKF